MIVNVDNVSIDEDGISIKGDCIGSGDAGSLRRR